MTLGIDASDSPLELDAVGWPHAVIEQHPGTRTIDLRRSEHSPQGGSDEDLETDQGGNRVAWQTEYQGVSRGREVEWLPRLHEYAAEVDLSELGKQRLDEIEVTHRDAATRDDDVTLGESVD
jgi:hypothetical protein